ncbi:hypothetical protein IHN32_00700 [Deinococcus sp. 14RED07]|uniref:hypothetical protein n=2 Tax=unclassified Deinococcus TaxID=2623546 RepID=UPI001E5372F0|nr:hypothetical protein [Deinococcus sp. 14RED07]MCD0174475.1 hypothetical protein [Deinococcus sp. 14RED07]
MSIATLEHQMDARQQVGIQTVLNAYELLNDPLQWQVNVYRVDDLNAVPGDAHRDFKALMYRYARRQRAREQGPFWTLDAHHVAAPLGCVLSDGDIEGVRITTLPQRTVDATDVDAEPLVREILKSATRAALRNSAFSQLIQEGTRFIEQPSAQTRRGTVHHCRRYEVRPMAVQLSSGVRRWVLQLLVDTVTLDGRSVSDYYRRGEVDLLADMVEAKRRNRWRKSGGPTAIRALYLPEGGTGQFGPLVNPERFKQDADLTATQQKERTDDGHSCLLFRRGEQVETEVPGQTLHVVLDTQLTGQSHDDTILDVQDRLAHYRTLRAALHDAPAYGVTLALRQNLAQVASQVIAPPPLRLTGRTLPAPSDTGFRTLQDRYRARKAHVRAQGYLHRMDINPLVAVPAQYGQERGTALVRDLQAISQRQGLELRFAGPILYTTVQEIQEQLGHHDALIAVLPEGHRASQHSDDMHEQIKRTLSVTSQCIHHDNTRQALSRDARQARGAQHNYEAIVENLLVKHGWVPFLPAAPAQYNVRFGIDVGGVRNDRVMVCLGYGFGAATPIFHAEEIKVDRAQAEPIQDGPLYRGMLALLSQVRAVIDAKRIKPDFEHVLFLRDGDSNGEAGIWQERDAFARLHAEFKQQGWISDQASWVLVEVSKRAAGWRQLRVEDGRTINPLVGTVSFPFADPHQALISTTGSPTLDQGTAQPLLVTMTPVSGPFNPEVVVRDLVWEADLGFTKLDQGYALPFTLHVADSGALQLSRTYDITGLTL